MPTIYCDQNILITVLKDEGFPPQGTFGELVRGGQARLIFSLTHLVEALKSRTLDGATQLGELMDWSASGWLRNRLGLELDEIRTALGVAPQPTPICRTLIEVLALLHNENPREAEVVTAVQMARGWKARPALFEPMENSVRQNQRAFRDNVRRFGAGKLSTERDTELSRAIIRRLCQIHGIPATADQLSAIEIDQMPTFHTEAALSRIRWGRGGKLRWQGFMDNEHLIVGLPHVAVYLTFDIRQRRFARRLTHLCSSARARVAGSLREVLEPS